MLEINVENSENCDPIIISYFICSSEFDNYRIFPLNNRPADHDVQLITINIALNQSLDYQTYFKRNTDFQIKLSYETWDSVIEGDAVNKMFNSFFEYLFKDILFSFPLTKVNRITTNISWITQSKNFLQTYKKTTY